MSMSNVDLYSALESRCSTQTYHPTGPQLTTLTKPPLEAEFFYTGRLPLLTPNGQREALKTYFRPDNYSLLYQ